MENQDLKNEAVKEKSEIIQHSPNLEPDVNDDNIYLSSNTSNSTNPKNEALQDCEDKGVYYEERYVSIENEAYEQDEIIADKKVISKQTRKSNRLSVSNKKENVKKTVSSKVIKKRTTKKSNKAIQSAISNEISCKKFASEKDENLISVRFSNPNNTITSQFIPYGIVKPEESHNSSSNTNRNILQYLDYNDLRRENLKQQILNSHSWLFVPKNSQNFALNNISNMQNQVGQTNYINDKLYHNVYTADYNLKQGENPYFQSSIKSVDSHKLFGIENKVLHCSCNYCTNNLWNNMHTGIEAFPKTNNTFQQIGGNNISNNIPLAATSNNFWNTGSFNYSPYPPLQAGYDFKRLFYSGFNTINNMNDGGFNAMANKNVMSPLNNWNTPVNHLSIPYNSNLNVALDTSIASEPRPESSSSFYTGNTSTQFSNYYNKDLTKVDNMSVNQYKEKDNFDSSTVPIFKNSLSATNTHALDSDSTNTLSQNTTSSNEMMYDVTNFVSETNTDRFEESPPYTYVKEMDKNWQ